MKKLSSILLTSLSLVSIALSPVAQAGNRPGAMFLTAGGGYLYLDSKRNMENDWAWMAQLSYDITEHWGLEGTLVGFNTDFKPSVKDHRDVDGTIFTFNGVYHFLPASM